MQKNKELRVYVEENLAKGYSLNSIKKALVSSGCDQILASSLTSEYSVKPRLLTYSYIFILLAVLFSSLFFIKPSYVGYVSVTKEISFTDDITLIKNTTTDYLWLLDNPADLNSVKLSGSVSSKGAAKVYIENDGQSYLIFDSEKLSEKAGLPGITSLSTLQSADPTDNSTIKISLEYDEDSVYDDDNNGIEFTDGIIDFTVKNSIFDLDEEKLCTEWLIESLDNNTVSKICHGNKLCCNFINLEPADDLWNNPFYLNYNAYGSSYSNIVAAQILFVDYNLSLESPYTNIQYSQFMNLSAVFYPEFIDFDDICLESCSLSGFNDSLYNLIIEVDDAILNLDSIKYTTLKDVPNRAPFFNAVPSYKIEPGEKLTINLSRYAYDLDNDTLVFSSSSAENLTIEITNNAVRITPDNFQGRRFVYFIANDSVDIAVSNTIEINVVKNLVINKSESLKQGIAVIGKPVKWVKTVALNDTMTNLSINISDEALNFTVKKVVYGIDEEISADRIKVIHEGVKKNVSDYVNEKKVEIINKKIIKLENSKKEQALNTKDLKAINEKLVDYENEKNQITGYAVSVSETKGILTKFLELLLGRDITGFAVKEKKGKSLGHNKTVEIIIDEEVEDVEIEYYTEAPTSTEVLVNDFTKQIIVSSDVHYENILTYTNISPQASVDAINLYWLVNDTRKEFSFEGFDRDGDNLVDYIQWITPSLSNQTFEIEITILNVYSHPTLFGNWTVEFETSGAANLTITATRESNYTSEYTRWTDFSGDSELYDLKFLGLRCSNTTLNYTWIGDNCSLDECSVFITGYSCNQTGYEVSNVLTPIKHVLKFEYGGQIAYAYNDVTTAPWINFTSPTPDNASTQTATNVEVNISITEAADLDEVIYNWNGTNFTIFNDSLVLMYNFDNVSDLNENSTHVLDISGHDNNATVIGATWNAGGKYGGAFEFDGDNDYISSFNPYDINTGNLSISFWVYPYEAPSSNHRTLISNRYDTSGTNYKLAINYDDDPQGTIYVNIVDDSETDFNSDSALALNAWNHLFFTRSGSSCKIYLDGVLDKEESSCASGDISSNSDWVIGVTEDSDIFYGLIDELRIWNRSLTAAEIQIQHMSNLKKYNIENWSLFINQSKNSTDVLSGGIYTYQAFVKSPSSYINSTELRYITINNPPTVHMVAPSDNTKTGAASYILFCNITDTIGIKNLTVYVWNQSGGINYTNTTILTGIANSTNWTYTFPSGGTFTWNCLGYDSSGSSVWSTEGNYTLIYDLTPPGINFTNPTIGNGTIHTERNVEINVSITNADDLDKVIYNWNGTNYTIYNDSLVLMFNFDNVSALGEGTSDNITVDLSSYGNNGTIYNMTEVGGNYT
ncbi:MAG: LamG domain-containing protein, partial [Nanoarchaeota archaeon]